MYNKTKSIIRTQRRKLCERACVRKYSGQDAEPRVCRFPRHSLYSPLPCLVFILYSPLVSHPVFALLHSVSVAIFTIHVSNFAMLKLRNSSVAIR